MMHIEKNHMTLSSILGYIKMLNEQFFHGIAKSIFILTFIEYLQKEKK